MGGRLRGVGIFAEAEVCNQRKRRKESKGLMRKHVKGVVLDGAITKQTPT